MNYRLFIADDSKVLCKRLTEMLSEIENLEIVGQAHTYADAVEMISKTKPDAAILDIFMPGGTGIEILEKIKKNNSKTKIIIFTNFPYPQFQKKCAEEGADYFFDKYTEFDKLLKTINSLIRLNNKMSKDLLKGNGLEKV